MDAANGTPAVLEGCLARIVEGEREALALLYEQTRVMIYGFALSICKNAQDAEDVLQDTYTRVWTNAASYRPSGKPLAWLFTVARNLALMKLREERKTLDLPQEEWERLEDHSTSRGLEDKAVLRAAMERLSDEERQIVMLHAVAGFRHRETAALLTLPLPTVLSKYQRALKKLRTILKEETI